jgi:hypothetical protein
VAQHDEDDAYKFMGSTKDRFLIGQPVFLPFVEVSFEQIVIDDNSMLRVAPTI